MLDLYKLHIFSVVIQSGSFSAAAERLQMTQSAVSQHIKELESSLGRQLFQRGWRGVTLTAHGEILKRYTDDIFDLVSKAENALLDVERLTSGRISVGATPGIGIYLIPEWVQHFRSRYPQLTVALQTGITPQIISDVLSQRLDIGLIEGELDDHPPARLGSLVLENIEQKVVVGFKHDFWERSCVSIEDLRERSLIVREVHSQSRIWLEDTLHEHGIEPVIGAEFDNLESIKRAVALGMCVAVLPPYVVQTEIEYGLLRMIPFDDTALTRSLKLIWDTHVPFSPITRAFLTELSQRYEVIKTILKQDEDLPVQAD